MGEKYTVPNGHFDLVGMWMFGGCENGKGCKSMRPQSICNELINHNFFLNEKFKNYLWKIFLIKNLYFRLGTRTVRYL
jgi:hypothetical protein